MSITNITTENFDSEVLKSEKAVLLDFWAEWCGPCRMFSPIIDELAEKHDNIKVGKVNVDQQAELAQKFGIVSIPTIVIMKGREVISKSTGFKPINELEELIENL